MGSRFWNGKLLLGICFLSLFAACSNNNAGKSLDNSSLLNGELINNSNTPSAEGQIIAPPSEDNSQLNVERNTAQPIEILNSISGLWSSTCRDNDSKVSNTSEKDVIDITLDPNGNSITFYTLTYSASRNCEKKYIKNIDEYSFQLGDLRDGHTDRNSALALDLIDGKMSLEKPQNVLLVFASTRNSAKKGRILFEVYDTQRTGIRLQIDEWRSFLPERMKDQEAVSLQLESILNAGDSNNRRTPYTKSQAFSRSLPEDLDIMRDYLED